MHEAVDRRLREAAAFATLRGRVTLPQALAIAGLALAHLFDYVSFLVLLGRHGLAAEANPIVVRIAEEVGLPGLTLAKVATVAFAVALALVIAPRRRRLAFALLIFGIAAGLVGGITNVASL